MMRSPGRIPLLALLLLSGAAAHAQQTCTPCNQAARPLVEPCVIEAGRDGALDTTFSVEMLDQQVPVWSQKSDKTWQCCLQTMKLRSYVPADGRCQQQAREQGRWFPAPTLKVSKADKEGGQGDRIKIQLLNQKLGPDSGHECNPCTGCSNPPNPAADPKCCSQPASFRDTKPNCFHGDNTTNLHFHGSHVSPQAHQDYVLVSVTPQGQPGMEGATSHGRGPVVPGKYDYSVDPLRWTQPEGTHWYHPHKHGSTALQVANGMAGALIIRGPFDDWLSGYYKKKGKELKEKVLVLQQLNEDSNFGIPAAQRAVPQPLINGQASPVIEMEAGEVQRWRLVSATMEGGAQFTVNFAQLPDAQMIAVDGVRFSPKNYEKQQLLPKNQDEAVISPGNRVDLLVKAPTKLGTLAVTYEITGVIENEERKEQVQELLEFLAPGDAEPTLITIKVVPCKKNCNMDFPAVAEWPQMPAYLRDIDTVTAGTRDLWFRLEGPVPPPDGPVQEVGRATQPSKFYINFEKDKNQQYNPDCVPITARLDSSEEWTIRNTTRRVDNTKTPPQASPFHVFHMHTNPFQLRETWGLRTITNGADVCEKIVYDPPIWMDSVTLPSACKVNNVVQAGYVKIRQRYEEFTGEFVLHCHFLGHEDRGMMLGVQVVCPKDKSPDPNKLYFGKPTIRGPECVPNNWKEASPVCADSGPAAASTHGH